MATPSLFLASKLKVESLANAKLKSLAISYALPAGTPYTVRKSMLPSVGVQREGSHHKHIQRDFEVKLQLKYHKLIIII